MKQVAQQFVSDIAFTPAVKDVQSRFGSRNGYENMEQGRGWRNKVTEELSEFIAQRDSIYLGTSNADGQPYIQHRGGPLGFLKVIDDSTLAFADFSGNRQYISLGNISENNRAFIFLMDYANQRRIKIWGTAEVVEDDTELLKQLTDPEYGGRSKRAFVFHIEAWDVNCPQHIPRLYSEDQITSKIESLQSRVTELEAEKQRLRRQD